MHSAATIEAVFLDMLGLVNGKKKLEEIGDKHGVALATLYLWRRDFKRLAKAAPGVVGVEGRRVENSEDRLDVDEEQGEERVIPDIETTIEPPVKKPWRRPRLHVGAASLANRLDVEERQDGEGANSDAEITTKPPSEKKSRRRQRDGCYSLPAVAEMVGKDIKEVRAIVRDYDIKPETILSERQNRNVMGYSEESIERIKSYESRKIDSIELRQILGLKAHTYQRFLEYILLRTEEPLLGQRFSGIRHTLLSHKKSHSYTFDKTMISDFHYLKELFIEGNDGRKRGNRALKKHLRSLRPDKNGVTGNTPSRTCK